MRGCYKWTGGTGPRMDWGHRSSRQNGGGAREGCAIFVPTTRSTATSASSTTQRLEWVFVRLGSSCSEVEVFPRSFLPAFQNS
eukprot:52713-Rhodomonas_salina.2